MNSETNFLNINALGEQDNRVVDWENGNAVSGGGYRVDAAPPVLNGDGVTNQEPSSIITDNNRPGAGEKGAKRVSDDVSEGGSFWDDVTDFFQGVDDTILDAGEGVWDAIWGTETQTDSNLRLNIDPLVLDLDGDGVELTAFDRSGVLFDIDVDGAAERTGWVGVDDGILVHDANANGRIDDASEMISEYYGMTDRDRDPPFRDGFAALASLDSNDDGGSL